MAPRIHLLLDSCFGIKRFVRPDEWMRVARDLGFTEIEASTDNECDPLFNPPEYLSDWLKEVRAGQARYGVKVSSFFTGYQTYRTVGLAHHDQRVRDHLLNNWFRPMFQTAGELGAALGVYFHAFSNEVLQTPEGYAKAEAVVLDALSTAAAMAAENGVNFCYEQMYAPHQTPWTIDGTFEMLRAVKARGGNPMYVALDVGHQVGQARYTRPDRGQVESAILRTGAGERPSVWLGTDKANEIAEFTTRETIKEGVDRIVQDIDEHSYLFASSRDTDTYEWIEALGCYSPIIHLQQTDGVSSHHANFTPEANKTGIIDPRKVLEAIAHSYDQPEDERMPQKVEDIYLAFEIIAGTKDSNRSILDGLKMSLEHWRTAIPTDGERLDVLLLNS